MKDKTAFGDPAQTGPQWVDKFGRVRTPRAYIEADDGTVLASGPEAIAAAMRVLSAPARQRGRSSRPAMNHKVRGSRRSSVRRSSERSGDSGDGEGSEPPERPCACGCGRDISHRARQAKYFGDAHAAADRQRRRGNRDRDWTADVSRADPYLRHEPEEVARARRRVEEGCRCDGHHIADPEDHHCIKCGHTRAHGAVFVAFIAARSAETRRPRRPELSA